MKYEMYKDTTENIKNSGNVYAGIVQFQMEEYCSYFKIVVISIEDKNKKIFNKNA